MQPTNLELFTKCVKSNAKKFGNEPSFESSKYIVSRYLKKGGTFAAEEPDPKTIEQEKSDALDALETALLDHGFTRLDENSFIVGSSQLQFTTLGNLLAISALPWYQYTMKSPVVLKSKSSEIVIAPNTYFCVADWGVNSALIKGPKQGMKPVRVPLPLAYALVHASRTVMKREKRHRGTAN